MPALKLNDAAFGLFLSKPVDSINTDLSNANVTEVIEAYEHFKQKSNPHYTLSSEINSISLIEKQYGIVLEPLKITDEFWPLYQFYFLTRDIKGSTIKKYIGEIIAAMKWGTRHQLPVSSTYDCYDRNILKYERTKVVLTADDVSIIAHYDIMATPMVIEDYYERAADAVDKRYEPLKRKKTWEYGVKLQKAKATYIADKKKIIDSMPDGRKRKTKLHKLQSRYMSKLAKIRFKYDVAMAAMVGDAREAAILKRQHQMEVTALAKHKEWLRTLCKVRDQFVLQCNLGQRYSDICRIEPSCFSDDRNTYTCIQQKTGNKAVVDIKAACFDRNVTRAILKRYFYHAPYPHDISNFNKHLHELLRLIGGRFTEMVKTENKIRGEIVVEEIPKWRAIASHTARRSFASYNVKRGIKEELIRRWTGHKDSKSFVRYIIFGDDDV